jgi:hypothetical protein
MDQLDQRIRVREVPFLGKAVIGATIATIAVGIVDRVVPHTPALVLPFGEPWLSLVGGTAFWVAAFCAAVVGRLLYLAFTDPYQ